jgi:GATA-binding protein, other eukaryote
MSAAQYDLRGGLMRATRDSEQHSTSITAMDSSDHASSPQSLHTEQNDQLHQSSQAESQRLNTLKEGATNAKLDLSPTDAIARNELLRGSFFPDWKDDSSSNADIDSPREMQKKDPLATQIWKLYSRTKNQLPNQERMENLTWRMMALTLKRKQEAARFVMRLPHVRCLF